MRDPTAAESIDDIDPDIRLFAEQLNRGYEQISDFAAMPLPERRAAVEAVRARWRLGGPKMQRISDLDVSGIPLRLHIPDDGPLPAMLYIHGGGWTMFSIETHDRLMREYAGRAGIIVAGIEYSLSPEAKFPTALEEIVSAVDWIRKEGESHGIDTTRLAIGGDSAGANLAVAANLKLREQGKPLLDAMLLNYGAFGPAPMPSYERYDGPTYTLTVDEMRQFWENYTRDASDFANPLVAPIEADLADLPPTFLAIAECDILADGNRAMAERLAMAGVPTEAHVYHGATHSFLEAVSIASLAERALDESAQWLRTRFDLD